MPVFDAIIIGAGPAGSATALRAGRAGPRVLLLDAKTFPRDTVRSDSRASAAMANVRDLGLEGRLLSLDHVPVREVSFFAPDGTTATVPVLKLNSRMRAAGMICSRVLFDEKLFEAARELANVSAMTWCRATDTLIKDGRACGVTVDRGAEGWKHPRHTCSQEPTAPAPSWPARWTCLTTRNIGASPLRPISGRSSACADTPRSPEETRPGNLWLHPTRTSQTSVGLALPLEPWMDKRPRLETVLEQALALPSLRKRFAFAEQMGKTQVRLPPVGNTLRQIHGEGFLLVGDAAGLATPRSTEGVANALMSARVAAAAGPAHPCGQRQPDPQGLAPAAQRGTDPRRAHRLGPALRRAQRPAFLPQLLQPPAPAVVPHAAQRAAPSPQTWDTGGTPA